MKPLTVGALKKALDGIPDNTIVILGDDDEFNGCHNAWYSHKQKLGNVKEKPVMIKSNGQEQRIFGTIYQGENEVFLGKEQDINKDFIFLIS